MMKDIKFVLLLILILAPGFLFAQDIHFSQFYMSPLTLNPAMAGSMQNIQVTLVSREQWRSAGTPFRTAAASFDMRINPKKRAETGYLSWGINMFSDKAGDGSLGVNQGNLSLAYHVILDDNNTLGAGFLGGFAQRSINFASLRWGNQFDGGRHNASLPSGESFVPVSGISPDMGAGVIWTYNPRYKDYGVKTNKTFKASAGAAVFHINQPDYSFVGSREKLYMRYVLHGNAQISLNQYYSILPGIVYNRQGPSQSLYTGSMVQYKIKQSSYYTGIHAQSSFALGAFVRLKDAVSFTMLYEHGNYAFGFSYDINTSPLNASTNGRGGWEVSLRFLK